MPIVVIERGNDKGKSLKLEPGKPYVFGRDPNVGIPLSDPLTSRRHFEISSDGKLFRLRDLGSTNGTFLNDEKVEDSELKVGDKIQAGETILSFLSDQREETAQGLVGKTIGGYKILERVGRGGMGTVYKANQLSLNRIVAFKVLSARLLKDEKFIERFKSEARAAGQLNHPNIVGVYDVGTDREIHFFSMEFMDGGSVQDVVGKDDKLPWNEALDILMQAARALIFAEKKGIVHRDVKPDNLMLTSDGQIKLADLGLARKLDGSQEAVEEGIFGTPHFISPEQAQGRDVDHRADLYSLGATAYRMLSGRTPFQGSNVPEIIQQQIGSEPPPLRQYCPDAPDELIGVVARLMKKNPDDRYSSAEDLLEELEGIRLRYHLKVHGGGGGKGLMAAVAVALLAVVAVIVFALTRNNGSNGNRGTIPSSPPIAPSTSGHTATGTSTSNQANSEEVKRRQKELDAKSAFLDVQARASPLGPVARTGLARKKEWEPIAEGYSKVEKEYPDTEYGGKAGERAKEIQNEIARQEKAEKAVSEAAQKTWLGLKRQVNDALQAQQFAEALKILDEQTAKPEVKSAVDLVTGAADEIAGWRSDDPRSIRGRFAAAWAAAKQAAEESRTKGDFRAAVLKIRGFLKSAAGEDKRDPFAAARNEGADILDAIGKANEKRCKADLAADRTLYYRTWRAARHYEVDDSPYPDNPVFEYRFEDAAKRFDAILSGETPLKTDVYRARATASAARLRAAQGLMDSLIAHFRDRKLSSDDLNFPTYVARANVTVKVNWDQSPAATRDGLNISERILLPGGGVADSKRLVNWSDFLPADLWTSVFLAGSRFPMTPADHAGAALFLTITGVRAAIDDEVSNAGKALSEADREWIAREVQAMDALDLLNQAKATRPPAEIRILATNFVKSQCPTDFFTLVYQYPDPWQRLLPEATIEAWVKKQQAELYQ